MVTESLLVFGFVVFSFLMEHTDLISNSFYHFGKLEVQRSDIASWASVAKYALHKAVAGLDKH